MTQRGDRWRKHRQAIKNARQKMATKENIKAELQRQVVDKAKDKEKAKDWFRKHVEII